MLIGLVGRPNAGKSTFFKAATLADVLIANYPFATIKPNRGMAYIKIPDLAAEFGKVSNPREGYVKQGWRFVPFELMDVAGLVAGASEGKGLGNEFLNDLSAADAFIHVVDLSGETDGEGKPTENYYPGTDITVIERELDLWYAGILNKVWGMFARSVEIQHTQFADAIARQFSGLKVTSDDVKHIILKHQFAVEKPSTWTPAEVFRFARELRRSTKPMIIAANKVDRPLGRAHLERIKTEFDYPIIPCFADGELSLRMADRAGLIEYIPGAGEFTTVKPLAEKQAQALAQIQETMQVFGNTGVQTVLNAVVLELLAYIAVYPAGAKLADSKGNVLPDCFLMKSGTTALDFAYRLHTDIGRDFIKAIDIRTKQAVGKDHVLKHMDGLEIMTK